MISQRQPFLCNWSIVVLHCPNWVGQVEFFICCLGVGPRERENVQSSSDSRVINVSSSSLMYSLTSYSKNLRGTAPHCSTTSWKSLISNLSPANKILINFKNNEVAEFFVSINPFIFLLLFNVLASYKLYPLLGRFFNLRGNLVNFEEKNENKILVLFIKFSYMYLVHF